MVLYDSVDGATQRPVTTWDSLAAATAHSNDLVAAVSTLRRFLGDNWSGFVEGRPLATQFGMSLQGGPAEWVRLNRLIGHLENVRGMGALVRMDLGSSAWPQYVAAVMALEFCGRFAANGRFIEFIETSDHEAPADAFVDVAHRRIRVEFKALHEAEFLPKWHDLMQWVTNQLSAQGADNEVDVWCDPSALENREALLADLIAVRDAKDPDMVDLPSGTGQARYTGLNVMGWSYPEKQRPDLERLLNKLTSRWWKKFRNADRPGLLVVRTSMLFGESFAGIELRAQEIAEALTAVLPSIPGASAVVIYDDPFWPPIPATHVAVAGGRLCTGNMDGCARVVLLVAVPEATFPLTNEELQLLVGPDMIW